MPVQIDKHIGVKTAAITTRANALKDAILLNKIDGFFDRAESFEIRLAAVTRNVIMKNKGLRAKLKDKYNLEFRFSLIADPDNNLMPEQTKYIAGQQTCKDNLPKGYGTFENTHYDAFRNVKIDFTIPAATKRMQNIDLGVWKSI